MHEAVVRPVPLEGQAGEHAPRLVAGEEGPVVLGPGDPQMRSTPRLRVARFRDGDERVLSRLIHRDRVDRIVHDVRQRHLVRVPDRHDGGGHVGARVLGVEAVVCERHEAGSQARFDGVRVGDREIGPHGLALRAGGAQKDVGGEEVRVGNGGVGRGHQGEGAPDGQMLGGDGASGDVDVVGILQRHAEEAQIGPGHARARQIRQVQIRP